MATVEAAGTPVFDRAGKAAGLAFGLARPFENRAPHDLGLSLRDSGSTARHGIQVSQNGPRCRETGGPEDVLAVIGTTDGLAERAVSSTPVESAGACADASGMGARALLPSTKTVMASASGFRVQRWRDGKASSILSSCLFHLRRRKSRSEDVRESGAGDYRNASLVTRHDYRRRLSGRRRRRRCIAAVQVCGDCLRYNPVGKKPEHTRLPTAMETARSLFRAKGRLSEFLGLIQGRCGGGLETGFDPRRTKCQPPHPVFLPCPMPTSWPSYWPH